MSTNSVAATGSSFSQFFQNKSWKFYASLVLGITVTSTGIFILSASQNQHYNDRYSHAVFTEDMYITMTDELISIMDAEQRSMAANTLKEKGNQAFLSRRYRDAISYYTQAIKFKASPVYYSNRAACYANLGDDDQVIFDCNEALLLNPEYTKAINRRAQALERKGDLMNALYDFTTVCILDEPASEDATKSMERLLKIISEIRANDLMKSRRSRLPSFTSVSTYLDSFHTNDQHVFIITNTTDKLGDSYYSRLRVAIAEKRYYEALECCIQALELGCSPELKPIVLNMKGTFLFLEGNHKEAMSCFNASIGMDEKLVQNYIKRASIYMDLGDIVSALGQFDLAISQNPRDPDIYYHRGQLYQINGRYDLAIKDYTQSIHLDPQFLYPYIQLGVAQFRLNELIVCKDTFRQTIARFPFSAQVHNYYGEILIEQENIQEASSILNKAIALDPTYPLPYINKAMISYQYDLNHEEAISLCKMALEVDHECDAAVASLAQILLEQNRLTEALVYYERAIDLARTRDEVERAVSYIEATKAQIRFAAEHKHLSSRLKNQQSRKLPY